MDILIFFALTLAYEQAVWKRSVVEDELPWESYLLRETVNSKLAKQFNFGAGIPLILLIDADQKIVAQNHDIRAVIRSIPFIRYEIKI